ncbi:MAG: hypothetical protein RSB71_02350 [Bacilli bacterium]
MFAVLKQIIDLKKLEKKNVIERIKKLTIEKEKYNVLIYEEKKQLDVLEEELNVLKPILWVLINFKDVNKNIICKKIIFGSISFLIIVLLSILFNMFALIGVGFLMCILGCSLAYFKKIKPLKKIVKNNKLKDVENKISTKYASKYNINRQLEEYENKKNNIYIDIKKAEEILDTLDGLLFSLEQEGLEVNNDMAKVLVLK